MSLARGVGRLLGRAWQQAGGAGQQQWAQAQQRQGQQLGGAARQAARSFADHGHGHGDPSQYVTYAGLTLKKAPAWEYAASKAVGGFMWFWVFKMLYDNWETKIYGLPYIFEKEGLDDDDDHGHGHGNGHH